MNSPYARRRERRRRCGDSRNGISASLTRSDASLKMSVPTGENFAACYMELCKQQRIRPLPVICVTLPQALDFTTDRVKMDDWGPILNSLTLDRSLRSISVRSRYQCRKPLEEINSADKVRTMGKAPVVLSRYLLEWLSHSVAQCVRNSTVLTCLELEGIPLPADCLATLCVGLSSTVTLQHLSLQRCYIGDNSCELVCRTVADVQSIRTLNLSQCDLSAMCGPSLAAALSRQKLSLYHDTWKQSLRYREPNLEAMPGLRRLTLNGNPHLGDLAVSELIEAIRDSLWLKAVDLQQCGLTNKIGGEIIDLLDSNKTLSVIDVRLNANLDNAIIDEIFRRLEINGIGNARSDYRWLSLPQKDNRNVVSAGARRRNRCEVMNNDAAKSRPISAFVTKSRRPYVATSRPPQRDRSSINREAEVKRTGATSNIDKMAVGQEINAEMVRSTEDDTSRTKERLALHVDLRTQLESVIEKVSDDPRESKEIGTSVNEENEEEDNKKMAKVDDGIGKRLNRKGDNVEEFNRIMQQLSEARMEHDRLLEEMRRTEVLLIDERSRRECAESKLDGMKRDLSELEAALREKESETRGYLLVSQRSLDDMAESFERLLEMLDHVTRNTRIDAAGNRETEEEPAMEEEEVTRNYSRARADMTRRVARLIRKSKSESHGGGLLRVECEETSVITANADIVGSTTKKFAKSEGNMRNLLPPIVQPIRLERNIGDSPDIVSSDPRVTNRSTRDREMADYNKMASPCERARALFARVVNGEGIINMGSHGS